MKCPACDSELTQKKTAAVTVDVCTAACGGMWLDANELDQVDEQSERVPFDMLRPVSNQRVVIDQSKKRQCPKCPGQHLTRVMDAMSSGIDLDTCPRCQGVFLDLGELEKLREFTGDRAERTATLERVRSHYQSCDTPTKKRLDAVFKLLF